jgi:hypothetical protein
MAEDAATLTALGGAALKGRRVNRFFLHETGSKGRYYAGAVSGPAKAKGMLVRILYDNGDDEELDAEELAECLLAPVAGGAVAADAAAGAAAEMSTPKAKRGKAAPAPAPVAATPKSTKRKSMAAVASPPPAAAAPPPPDSPVAATAGAAAAAATPASAKLRRDRIASPDKRYKGTTRNGLTWKAQLMVQGKLLYKCGFATEEEAARAWNVMAAEQGRTDLNVFPGEAGGAPVAEAVAPRAAPARLASPAPAKKATPPAKKATPPAKRFKVRARVPSLGRCLGARSRRRNARNCAHMARPRRSVSRTVLRAGGTRHGARRVLLLVQRHVRNALSLSR